MSSKWFFLKERIVSFLSSQFRVTSNQIRLMYKSVYLILRHQKVSNLTLSYETLAPLFFMGYKLIRLISRRCNYFHETLSLLLIIIYTFLKLRLTNFILMLQLFINRLKVKVQFLYVLMPFILFQYLRYLISSWFLLFIQHKKFKWRVLEETVKKTSPLSMVEVWW